MSREGVASARRSSEQLSQIVPLVDHRGWESLSACAGWRVIDVLAHLGALAHEAVDPPATDPSWPKNRERYHDMRVDERRGRSHAEVIEEWLRFTPRQLEILEAGQQAPQADEPVLVPGLGTYPRHLLANTMAFNVLCHLRYDMLEPGGPLPFAVPPPDDELVAPAVEFMLAGIPQMQGPELIATISRPVVLEFTGPGATTATIVPADGPDVLLTVEPGAADGAAAWIHSKATDFIAWGTTRTAWRDHCRITGEAATAEPFLDCLNIV